MLCLVFPDVFLAEYSYTPCEPSHRNSAIIGRWSGYYVIYCDVARMSSSGVVNIINHITADIVIGLIKLYYYLNLCKNGSV